MTNPVNQLSARMIAIHRIATDGTCDSTYLFDGHELAHNEFYAISDQAEQRYFEWLEETEHRSLA